MGCAGVVIPPGDIEGAKSALLGHACMIQGAARWLYDNGYHAASVYFSVLCLEEISKHCTLSGCEDRGRGVTKADLRGSHDHRAKLSRSLGSIAQAARHAKSRTAAPNAGLLAGEKTADALVRAKERALYFDFGGGSVRTLEALLGPEGTKRASGLLLPVVALGIGAMRPRGAALPEHGGGGSQDPQEGALPGLAQLAAMLDKPGEGATRGKDPLIPHWHLDTALLCLVDHLGDLAKITHELHAGGHEAASVFMGIMTIEEGSKHYLLAKCRRDGRSVTRKDMRDMRDHKEKLAVFFRHVARALGEENIDRETGGFRILDPGSLTRLHDVKKLAIHFVHMGGETVTLDAIFGDSMTNLADYVNQTAQWIISWMAMSDGDAGSPYARHDPNPIHYERYERFGRLVDDPENAAQYRGWSEMTRLLKALNGSAQNHDVGGCKAALAAIRKYGMLG